jgi:HK97 family phage portal protein
MDWRETVAGLLGIKSLYDRDYGGDAGVSPNPRTKIANRAGRTHIGAYGGDQPVDWVHDCVGLIMETTSNAEWHFERDGKRMRKPNEPKDQAEKDVIDAPVDLCGLLDLPNPYMDWVEHIELAVIDLLLAGEFFWLKYGADEEGKPKSLYRLSPALLEVVAHPTKFIEAYEYKPPGATEPMRFKPEDVIHAKLPNPHNPYRGLGVIAGGPRVYDVELALTESLAQYYEQGTRLSGVVTSERRVPDPVFKRIRRQFVNLYSGARNAYKVAVLENGLRFAPLASTAQQADYATLSGQSRDRIHRMFRVPVVLTNVTDDTTKDAVREGQRVFDNKTMRPLLNKIERIVTHGLTTAWDVEFKIDYEYVMPVEDRLKLAADFAGLPGVKVKEVRKQAGLEPSTGDDETDNIVLNLPPTPEELAAGAGLAQPAGGEGGRPPNFESTSGGRNKPVPGGGSGQPRRRGTYATSQARLRERQSQQKAMSESDMLAIIDPLRSSRTPTIEMLAYNIANDIRPASRELEKALVNALDEKALADIAKKIRNHRAWRVFTAQFTDVLMKHAKNALDAARNQHRILGYEPDEADDFDVVQIAADLVSRSNGIRSIVGTLKDDITKIVAEGVERNYSTQQIVEGVPGEDFDGLKVRFVGWRQGQAETIAATEAQEYYNEGSLQVAERTEHSHVFVVDGEDHDAPCIEANGQVWPVEYARSRRTEHPRCTRTFYPMPLGGDFAEPPPAPAAPAAPGGKAIPDVTVPLTVNVEPADVRINPADVNIEAPAAPDVHIEAPAASGRKTVTVKTDEDGNRVYEVSE